MDPKLYPAAKRPSVIARLRELRATQHFVLPFVHEHHEAAPVGQLGTLIGDDDELWDAAEPEREDW